MRFELPKLLVGHSLCIPLPPQDNILVNKTWRYPWLSQLEIHVLDATTETILQAYTSYTSLSEYRSWNERARGSDKGMQLKHCSGKNELEMCFFCLCWEDWWYHFVRMDQYQQILWTRLFGIETRYLMIAQLHHRDCICSCSFECLQARRKALQKMMMILWYSTFQCHVDAWWYPRIEGESLEKIPSWDRAGWTKPPDFVQNSGVSKLKSLVNWWNRSIGAEYCLPKVKWLQIDDFAIGHFDIKVLALDE